MKADWFKHSLADIAERVTDGSHNPPKGVTLSEYMMLSSKNVFDDCLHYSDPRYLNADQFKLEDRRTGVVAGDVLLTIVGTIGRSAVVRDVDPKFTLQRSVAVIRPRQSIVHSRFLMYSLIARSDDLNAQARGVAQKGIYLETLRQLDVVLPPLPEQQRIVTLLDEAFAGIATAKANAEKNLQNARELVDIGFHTLTEKLGRLKWPVRQVEALTASHKGAMRTGPFGSQLLHSEFVDEGIAVLGIDNAVANEFRWDRRRYITAGKYQQMIRYRVFPGDVLITIMGTCGRCAVVPDDIPLAINTKHLCCITLDHGKCLPGYLHIYFLHDQTARDYLTAQAKGSIMAGLNMGIISKLPVRLPSIQMQAEIVEQFESLCSGCGQLEATYQQKLTALDELKKSLLHRAFTGHLT